jgi:hypothetical protein
MTQLSITDWIFTQSKPLLLSGYTWELSITGHDFYFGDEKNIFSMKNITGWRAPGVEGARFMQNITVMEDATSYMQAWTGAAIDVFGDFNQTGSLPLPSGVSGNGVTWSLVSNSLDLENLDQKIEKMLRTQIPDMPKENQFGAKTNMTYFISDSAQLSNSSIVYHGSTMTTDTFSECETLQALNASRFICINADRFVSYIDSWLTPSSDPMVGPTLNFDENLLNGTQLLMDESLEITQIWPLQFAQTINVNKWVNGVILNAQSKKTHTGLDLYYISTNGTLYHVQPTAQSGLPSVASIQSCDLNIWSSLPYLLCTDTTGHISTWLVEAEAWPKDLPKYNFQVLFANGANFQKNGYTQNVMSNKFGAFKIQGLGNFMAFYGLNSKSGHDWKNGTPLSDADDTKVRFGVYGLVFGIPEDELPKVLQSVDLGLKY